MSGPTRRLRTRLLVAMVAIALGVLAVTAVVTAGLARQTAASAAQKDLEKRAPQVKSEVQKLGQLIRRRERLAAAAGTTAARRLQERAIDTALHQFLSETLTITDGSVVAIDATGTVQVGTAQVFGLDPNAVGTSDLVKLPHGLSASDLDTTKLLGGGQQTGRQDKFVFLATPLTRVNNVTPVLVLTQKLETRPFGRSGVLVLVAAALALLAAALVAAYLARRMTRPLAAMQTTAGRIADGDLAARVDLTAVPDDELGNLARAMNAMAEELDAARGHERAFLLSVSHDLRTPLTSIRGYAEAIADGAVEGTQARKQAAEVISSEARRLERLVADLLDLARLDAHQFSLRPRPVDAREVVADAVDAFRPQAAEVGVELEFVPDGPAPADVDPERLAQIVANLVENALKYARQRVTVTMSTRAGHLALQVDDDGPGIDAADLPHVFERLYVSRAAPGRKVGTGIGLAIVRELAAAMGGRTAVQPLAGAGTRFVVDIPAGDSVGQPVNVV